MRTRNLVHNLGSSWPALCLASLLLISLSACSTGGLGDILGGGSTQPPATADVAEVRGTVERVDSQGRFVELERVSEVSNLQSRSSGETLRIWTAEDTLVTYQGETYRPTDLERGDKLIARVEQVDGRWYAREDLRVTYDSSPDQVSDQNDDDGTWDDHPWEDDETESDEVDADFRGTVLALDTSARTIELKRSDYQSSRTTRGSSAFVTDQRREDVVTLHYDARTRVLYEGSYYEPENLERGDEILVDAERQSNRWIAEDIEVVENVRNTRGN